MTKRKIITQETIKIGNKAGKVKSSVKLLGVQTDAELNFNLHNVNICKSAANKFTAPIELESSEVLQRKRF